MMLSSMVLVDEMLVDGVVVVGMKEEGEWRE
jgi:coenzyme F420-reducing hydrogenase beta subunit